MALTAEHLIVVGRGRLLRDQSVAQFIAEAGTETVIVRSPETGRLVRIIEPLGAQVAIAGDGVLEVTDMSSDEIGCHAAEARVTLLKLSPVRPSLEQAYMALSHDAVEYRAPAAR